MYLNLPRKQLQTVHRAVDVVNAMISLVPLQAVHWKEVARIYQEGLDTGLASFEIEAPDWNTWDNKHLTHSRLVATREGKVVGWAALSPASSRTVYRGVAELSIYIEPYSRGQGVGHSLLQRLIKDSEEAGIWTIQSSIFPQNEASIKLHYANGFRLVGRREKIGCRNGRWFDNLLFERRSENNISS